MSDITLYGFPVSTHVRAVRIAFQEKAVPFTFREIAFDYLATEEFGRINPLRKMPALEHGAVKLFETPALLVYADAHGAGASLEPADALERARMWQFVSIAHNYLHPVGVMQFYFHNVLAAVFGMEPDASIAEAAKAPTGLHLDLIEAGLTGGYLAGGILSFADIYCGATVDYVARTRDGQEMLAERPRTEAWLASLRARPSFQSTFAPMLQGTDQA
jgi:glutathione S-transferase